MTFHEHRRGIVVMDGRRVIAKAQPVQGMWRLKLYGGCWIDAMQDADRLAQNARMKLRPETSTDLKMVRERQEARTIMQDLLQKRAE